MAKIVRFQIQDAAGQNLKGLSVKLSGNGSLDTNADGLAQFLVEDASNMTLEIQGSPVWSGSSAELQSREVYRQTDTGFART